MFLLEFMLINLAFVLIALLVCNVADTSRKTHARRLKRMVRKHAAVIAGCISSGDYRLPGKVLRSLRHEIGMEAFFKALKHIDIEDQKKIMLVNSGKITGIMAKENNLTFRAYFAYMLKDIKMAAPNGGGYGDLMLRFLDDRSVFVRENALRSIYSFGDAELTERAISHLSGRGITHNEKLLTDGLMAFAGDRELLAGLLMKHYDSLLECYRNSLISFLGFAGICKFDDTLIRRAVKEETSLDTICCITRKLNRVRSDRNLRYLLDMANRYSEGSEWEPAAIAVTGLGGYPGNKTAKETLKKKLLSRNWYVRKNSAASLASMGLSESDLEDIRLTNDRYAMDAINYAMVRAAHD